MRKNKLRLFSIWKIMLCLFFMCVSMTTFSQEEVTGTITDESGTPLVGVNVIETDTQNGVISDFDGNFSINLTKTPSELTFSYLGFKSQKKSVSGGESLSIVLGEDQALLDEIVVIGYGSQRKSDLTGSVSSVKGETLTVAPTPNLAAGLSGKVTGIVTSQPTGVPGFDNTTIRVRGISTLNDNSALIIVDGIPRPLNRIDPNEIESITVLKDAASAAIYGSRAANGVILVTTKRGGNKKTTFNFTTSYGVQSVLNQPQMMNALQFATHFNEATENSTPGADLRFSPQDIEDIRNGLTPDTNWFDELIEDNAPIKQYNLSVNGGNEKTSYFISLGHLDQDGLYATSGFKSYSLRSNIDNKIGKNLSIGLDLAGRLEETTNSAVAGLNDNPNSSSFITNSVLEGVGNGIPTFAPFVDGDGDGEVDDLGFDGKISSPIGRALHSGLYERFNNVFQSSLKIRYDIPKVEGLYLQGRYSYDASFLTRRAFQTPYQYYQPQSGGEFSLAESIPSARLNDQRSNWNQQTAQFSIGYDKTFGENKIEALLLYEQIEVTSNNISAFRDGFLGTSVDQFLAGSAENAANNGTASAEGRLGYVGRINYDRSGKYLLQVNFRYDASHKFAPGKRYSFFPAVSAGWKISEEDFFSKDGLINNLKLRASWGKFGNERFDGSDFQYLSLFGIESAASAVGGVLRTGITEGVIRNLDITWESATGTNIGFELGLLNNKIGFEFDYFTKNTKGILIEDVISRGIVPLEFGGELPKTNDGETKNSGVEAILRYSDNFGDFSLNASGNVTYATSEIVNDGNEAFSTLKGHPIGSQRGYLAIGLFQSREELDNSPRQDADANNPNATLAPGDIKYADINGDNVIDGEDVTVIGKSEIPETVFGLNLNMQYKGFALAANFQGATGFTRYVEYIPFSVESNSRAALVDSWRPGNENARFPRLTSGFSENNGRTSSFWQNDVTYLRLRNVELSYTLPSKFLQNVGIDNVRVFASATNLFTLTNVEDVDPEGPSTFRPYFPQLRSTTFGFNLTF